MIYRDSRDDSYEEPEDDFEERRRHHLSQIAHIRSKEKREVQKCLHETCPSCFGTGIRNDGSSCIHMISCPCPKCTWR